MNIETTPSGGRRIVLRQSEFKTYLTCGREFYLGSIRNLEPAQRKASVADVGTFVHAGLQAHYLRTKDPLLAIAEAVNAAIETDPFLVAELTAHGQLADRMVEGYLEWLETEAMDHGLTPIAVEERYETHIGTYYGIEVWVTGAVDLLMQDEEGGVWVYDAKTVDKFGGMTDMLDIDFQGQTYDLLIRRNTEFTPKGFVHNQLRRVKRTGTAKPPFYNRVTVNFNEPQRERHLWHLQGVADEIAQKVLVTEGHSSDSPTVHGRFRPLPTKDCSWRCDFVKTGRVCPAMDLSPLEAEEMLQSPLFKQKESL